jgi:hypothetical protein
MPGALRGSQGQLAGEQPAALTMAGELALGLCTPPSRYILGAGQLDSLEACVATVGAS